MSEDSAARRLDADAPLGVFDSGLGGLTVAAALRPGGTLLLTVPGITQIDGKDTTSWYWSLTRHGARVVAERAFPAEDVQVEGHGNVLSAIAFLHGIPAGELDAEELAARDPRYDLVVTVRAGARSATR